MNNVRKHKMFLGENVRKHKMFLGENVRKHKMLERGQIKKARVRNHCEPVPGDILGVKCRIVIPGSYLSWSRRTTGST